MLSNLYYLINKYTSFLYTVIYGNDYFFVDIWSFIHVISGLFIMYFCDRRRYHGPFMILLAVLVSWEVVEISFIYFSVGIFRAETIPDQYTDIIVGVIGGYLSRLSVVLRDKLDKFRMLVPEPDEIFISCAMSLLWVGFYGYRYNMPLLNSPGVNWLAFILWSLGLIIMLRVYGLYNIMIRERWLRFSAIWATYLIGLFAIEYIGYRVLDIRLITSEKPLIFGLIHGTIFLKVYYMLAGPAAILMTGAMKKLIPDNNCQTATVSARPVQKRY